MSLSGCSMVRSNVAPDVVVYQQPALDKAAAEINSGSCPVLSTVFMPDYEVMRDQARVQ